MAVSISISITQNSQNITNNTTNVTAKVIAKWTGGSYNLLEKSGWLTIDGTKYTFTSPFNTGRSTSGSATLFTKTVNVSHASNGTKTLACSASYTSGVSSGTVTASASKTLTTIPRKSTLSVANGTLNTAQTLTVTRQSTDFTHTITYTCGSASGTICTKSTSTSVSFTPPLSLASQNTTGTSVTIKYTITTYNGDTPLGSNSYSKTLSIPSSVKPTCAVSVSDATGYASTYGGYIQGVSKFKVTVTGTPAYGSTIASYSTSANGSTYSTASFTTDVIKNSGTATITGKVTDKRDRSGSKSVDATVLAYSKPKITNLSVGRCDQDGTDNDQGDYIKVKYSCSITSLSSKNTLTSVVKYKKTSVVSYTSQTDISASTTASYTDRTVIIADDSGSSYDIELSITDNFGTTTQSTSVSTPFTFHHYKGPNENGEGQNLYNYKDKSTIPEGITIDENGWITITCDNASGTSTQYINYWTNNLNLETSTNYVIVMEVKSVSGNASIFPVSTMDNTGGQFKNSSSIEFSHCANNPIIILSNTTKDDFTNVNYGLRTYANFSAGESGSITFRLSVLKDTTITVNTFKYEPYITAYKASMGLGKLAEFEGGLDIGFQTRLSGGIKQVVIPDGVSLDSIKTPNVYTGTDASMVTGGPISSGSFTLTVKEAGGTGQLKQIFEKCNKDAPITWERFYYSDAWGSWVEVSDYRATVKDSVLNVSVDSNITGDVTLSGSTNVNTNMIFANNVKIMGVTSGVQKEVFNPQTSGGHVSIGYGNYDAKSGNTNVCGYDVSLYVSNTSSGISFRPYYRKGDSITCQIYTAGFLTTSGTEILFTVPLSKPIVGNPTVTVSTSGGFILRQHDDGYTHGSAASTKIYPSKYSAISIVPGGITLRALVTATSPYTNNAPIGIDWSGTITLS